MYDYDLVHTMSKSRKKSLRFSGDFIFRPEMASHIDLW